MSEHFLFAAIWVRIWSLILGSGTRAEGYMNNRRKIRIP